MAAYQANHQEKTIRTPPLSPQTKLISSGGVVGGGCYFALVYSKGLRKTSQPILSLAVSIQKNKELVRQVREKKEIDKILVSVGCVSVSLETVAKR